MSSSATGGSATVSSPNKAVVTSSTASGGTDERELVCAAVALGWQMAELYHPETVQSDELAAADKDLPGIGRLLPEEKRKLRIAQIEHGLSLIASATRDKDLKKLQYESVKQDATSDELREFHVRLLSALTVADFLLGKAYNLGRALCEVCWPGQEYEALEYHLGEKHLAKLIAWCADLKSALPDHAGQAVSSSLRRWQSWGRQRPWTLMEKADFDRRLDRQGERWRAVLTGEKNARDLLTTATYIRAGEELLSDAAQLTAGFLKRFWAAALLAAVLVFGGIAAIVLLGGNGVIGGLASIATGLGLSWKTATPTLTKLGGELSDPLWEAELDAAITVAVTDPMVPATSAMPPSDDQPVPVLRATDPRTTRATARKVWKQLDRATKNRALAGRKPLVRLGYRYAGLWRGGARAAFLPHDPFLNHVQSALEARLASKDLESSASSRDELFSKFGPNDWEWIKTVVQGGLTMLDGKRDFGVKPCEQRMSPKARIVLFGDWATGTPRAEALAKQIKPQLIDPKDQPGAVPPPAAPIGGGTPAGQQAQKDPETYPGCHLIHLGDVYYCGEPDEYRRRFLRYWPARGLKGVRSWNLNGNHDMYSGGHGYFDLISPSPVAVFAPGAPGTDGASAASFAHQDGTSFFRIFNDHWQIIGLDSAYVDNDFDARQLPWLGMWLGLDPGDENPPPPGVRRKTILLSHHQLGSSRAQASVSPEIRKKTAEAREAHLIDAWFWGHEHRAFVYDRYLDVECPVCVGNGGVPELLSHVFTFAGAFQAIVDFVRKVTAFALPRRWTSAPRVKFEPKSRLVDRRGLEWEKFGFVVLELNQARGRAVYHAEDGDDHIRETYEIESFGA